MVQEKVEFMALPDEENEVIEGTEVSNSMDTGLAQGMRKGDFIQYAGIPVIGLMIYTATNNLLITLILVIMLYANVLMLLGSMRLLRLRSSLLDSLIVVNLSFVGLAVLLFSISFAFNRADFAGIELWQLSSFFYGAWFLMQSYFARRIAKINWVQAFAGVLIALLGSGALFFVLLRAFDFVFVAAAGH